jgi:hypothetical protein
VRLLYVLLDGEGYWNVRKWLVAALVFVMLLDGPAAL